MRVHSPLESVVSAESVVLILLVRTMSSWNRCAYQSVVSRFPIDSQFWKDGLIKEKRRGIPAGREPSLQDLVNLILAEFS